MIRLKFLIIVLTLGSFCSCGQIVDESYFNTTRISVGAERFGAYINMLEGKDVALVANQTSVVDKEHLVDTLLAQGVNITKIFVPEHGFRGQADAGEFVENARDKKTKLPLVSLYGRAKKPFPRDLVDVEIMIFDLQDVGVRFYTYISTLYYVMEACADNDISLIVLDRPNPNGHYVDGPVLDMGLKSFVGMFPIPIVHGLTIGELAQMIIGEKWLESDNELDLTVIECTGYSHKSIYELPIAPSPNLKHQQAIYLYPSIGLFEGTVVSEGRGTDMPFLIYGHPDYKEGTFEFTPVSREGAKFPKHENKLCKGNKLENFDIHSKPGIYIEWVSEMYNALDLGLAFFTNNKFFDLLIGNSQVKYDIINKKSPQAIKQSWQNDLNEYKLVRKKYLLYEDFE